MTWIYGKVRDLLNEGSSAVIVTVLDKQGSASREAGTKMLVKEDLSTEGSIGGGLLEAMAVMLAAEAFEDKSFIIKKTGPLVSAEYVGPEDKNELGYFNKLAGCIEQKKNLVAVTRFRWRGQLSREMLFEEDYFRLDRCFSKDGFGIEETEDELAVYCPIFTEDKVYIFGAGYIGQKLAQLTGMLGFSTVVLDERIEFANRERFPEADGIIVMESLREFGRYISIDKNCYIVIATRGHVDDTSVLEEVLRSDAGYIGMMGSRKKRDEAYAELMRKGFTAAELEGVHCPIGLDINALTPEDITVSIAAELVMVRRGRNG
jgi:xanthine dehydrogenase accessory factor